MTGLPASRTIRLIALASAACFLATALAIRALSDGDLEQYSGTALYASMVYAGVVFLWTRISPLVAGGAAIGPASRPPSPRTASWPGWYSVCSST